MAQAGLSRILQHQREKNPVEKTWKRVTLWLTTRLPPWNHRASVHTTSKYVERMIPLIREGLGFFKTLNSLYRVLLVVE